MLHRQIKRRANTAPMVRPASPHRERGLEMLRQGGTASEVAAELGVPVRTVERWARALGLRGPGRPSGSGGRPYGPHLAPRDEALPALDLLLQGEPIADIAAALGRSYQSIAVLRDRWLSNEPE